VARTLGTRSRFFVMYLLLGAAVGAALGAFIVLLQRPGPKPPPPWSSWRPAASSVSSQMREIAEHVGSGYRLADGNPMVAVRAPNRIDNRDLRSIVVSKVVQPRGPGDFSRYDRSSTAIYLLCGFGQHCTLAPATTARGTVLRREALELALYTLKYLHPIDNVLVFFPPAEREKTVSATLFFHRDELTKSLDHPLRRTLPQAVPPPPGQIKAAEKKTVDDLTKETYYTYVGTTSVKGYGNIAELLPPS
jgi:hypothetical protein